MEKYIQNHSPTIMFRETPFMLQLQEHFLKENCIS